MFKTFENTSFDNDNLLYEWKISSNKFVKRIENLIFKGFNIVCECVKAIEEKWCDIIVIHRK